MLQALESTADQVDRLAELIDECLTLAEAGVPMSATTRQRYSEEIAEWRGLLGRPGGIAGRDRREGLQGTLSVVEPGPAPVGQVELLDPTSRPLGLAQELEARLDAGIRVEAADRNARGEARPAVSRHQVLDDGFQRHPMQRVVRSVRGHGRSRRLEAPRPHERCAKTLALDAPVVDALHRDVDDAW